MSINELEFNEEQDAQLPSEDINKFSEAVLHSTDWTVETLVSQLTRGNIEMNPRFQRRDAWDGRRKSAFVESLILGLPVPQIVLAEKKYQRGKYIVLDGKQRLLTLMQFTGHADESKNNKFKLSGLEARNDLNRKDFESLKLPELENDLNAFNNFTIRTVVIRNWPNYEFLHLVFLRLNTGSVKLSPQELRQAMFPGAISNLVDDEASKSEYLLRLLNSKTPDPRMRDVELLVRFLAFHLFLRDYRGRMKVFLDETCEKLNNDDTKYKDIVEKAIQKFNNGIEALMEIFGDQEIARKKGSKSFNRAIFDTLIFYAADEKIREAMLNNKEGAKKAYVEAMSNIDFLNTTENDTTSTNNTLLRLKLYGEKLKNNIPISFNIPESSKETFEDSSLDKRTQICFDGF